jgi:DNA-directed RNA polymerase subunit RPC12/RpoP
MEKVLGSLKVEDEHGFLSDGQGGFKCAGCNGIFERPLLATVSSAGYVKRYYACPRCLSKVSDVKHDRHEEDREVSVSMEKVRKVALAKQEDAIRCRHFLGYLKKRSKDAPIPDDCLTCDKMIECLMR